MSGAPSAPQPLAGGMSVSPTGDLAGARVAVTRPEKVDGPLSSRLANAGASVLHTPLTRIEPPANAAPLRRAAGRLARYHWLVFTSATAVGAFRAMLAEMGEFPGPWPRIAAVGPATGQAIVGLLGRSPDVIPSEFTGGALAAAMHPVLSVAGRRVLWPRAEDARPDLAADLLSAGAILDAPVAYRTVADDEGGRRLAGLLADDAVDVVTLTSPSAARCLASACTDVRRARIAVIGNTTGAAAREAGLPVHVTAEENTIDALAAAVVADVRALRGIGK
jgi:uroporphyrinogen-III synthase